MGVELALDHHVRLREPRLDVALTELYALHHVGGLVGLRLDPLREQVLVQDRGVRRHRLDRIDDVGQHLVVHLDEVDGLGRDGRTDRRDLTATRVPVVQHLAARQDVGGHVPVVDHGLAGRLEPTGKLRAGRRSSAPP